MTTTLPLSPCPATLRAVPFTRAFSAQRTGGVASHNDRPTAHFLSSVSSDLPVRHGVRRESGKSHAGRSDDGDAGSSAQSSRRWQAPPRKGRVHVARDRLSKRAQLNPFSNMEQ
jgi:hypothetical protein